MDNQINSQSESQLDKSISVSRQAWGRLGMRLRSLTPSQLTRLLLVVGGIGIVVWLAAATWPALSPFVLGGVIAYALLPIVNWLDRFLPRSLAVLLTLGSMLALMALFLASLLPVIATQVTYVYSNLPEPDELQAMVRDLDAVVDTLPGPVQGVADEMLQELADSAQTKLDNAIRSTVNLGLAGVASLFNTISFVLGFLVIPAWLLDVLRDQREGVRTVNKSVPKWMQPDFWAVVRLIDRPFRTFFEGQVILAVATGIGLYLGFLILEYFGLREIQYKVLIAVLVALFQLIPSLGSIIGAVVMVLLGLLRSPETAVTALALYIVVQWLVNFLVAPRLQKRYINIHPAILLMVIVLVSDLGLVWVLMAAPLTAVLIDLFRYVYGRLNNPPLPAGVLPGRLSAPFAQSTLFTPFVPQEAKPPAEPAVPLAYRHGRAVRRSGASPHNQ